MKYVYLDLETTGLESENDEIIEFAAIKYDTLFGEISSELHFLCQTDKKIPDHIVQITGITNDDLIGKEKFSFWKAEVEFFLKDAIIIGHNINFDISFLQKYGIDIDTSFSIDTFLLSNFLYFKESSLSLGSLCESFGISLILAHRAFEDIRANQKLFLHILNTLKALSDFEKKIVIFFFDSKFGAAYTILLKELYGETKKYMYSEIFSEYISRIHEITGTQEKIKNALLAEKFDVTKKRALESLEIRDSQSRMIDMVDKNMKGIGNIVIEAPTGIGKTLGFLIPAFERIFVSGEKICISTSNKSLQDQLFYKDIPDCESRFQLSVSKVKVKGKRNYLSLFALEKFIISFQEVSAEKSSFLLKIFFWSLSSVGGELDECDFYGRENEWSLLVSALDTGVDNDSNPYKISEFYNVMRKNLQSADIIVTNHYALLSDAFSEKSFISACHHMIIDEAHNLDDVCTQVTKNIFSQKQYNHLREYIVSHAPPAISLALKNIFLQMDFSVSSLFGIFGDIFSKQNPGFQRSVLLNSAFLIPYQQEKNIYIHSIFTLLKQIKSLFQDAHIPFDSSLIEFFRFCEAFELLGESFDETLYIYALGGDKNHVEIQISLLHPGKKLQSELWSFDGSIVLTSATLQFGGDFSYIIFLLSLEKFETHILASEFDYSQQAKLYFLQDFGGVKEISPPQVEYIYSLFLLLKGNTLMLCTAFQQIKTIYSQLKRRLEKSNIDLLAQSFGGGKQKQIQSFKRHSDTSILLGTESFWEGIDIPGNDLRYLIVYKIPFSVPTDPIFIARSKLFKNDFENYAIPKALLKLKQGFGRLIRTKTDIGHVIILDDRIYATSWGKKFYDAFPKDIPISYGSLDDLQKFLEN